MSRITSMFSTTAMLLALTAAAWGQETSKPIEPGLRQVTLANRSPQGQLSQLLLKLQIKFKGKPQLYQIDKERFDLYVPKGWRADKPAPMIVWISDTEDGSPPQAWREALDRAGVLWLGARQAGSDRPRETRLGLALDAAHNAGRLFGADLRYITIAGQGGGAVEALALALHFPEIFSSALAVGNAGYHRDLSSPDKPGDPNAALPAAFIEPEPLRLNRVMSRSMITLVGRPESRAKKVFDLGFHADGFVHATFIAQEGDAALLDAGTFAKALETLSPPKD
ncbi:MAG: hypothetical protein IT440_02675 [Phycisphaeraceae bacterium]|nr:hypothetical protein [Phycisphaeraceae bacterium]